MDSEFVHRSYLTASALYFQIKLFRLSFQVTLSFLLFKLTGQACWKKKSQKSKLKHSYCL